jgi:malic enzyme
LMRTAMRRSGASAESIGRAVVMMDSRGLLYEGRASLEKDKLEFVLGRNEMASFDLDPAGASDLESVIRQVKPTILIGTCGTAGAFTEGSIREMARHARRPIVLPLSNPTSKTEALPEDILAWTEGRALVATGSPFPPVDVRGSKTIVGQANNAFVFPGIGLGLVVAEAREVTDEMFLVAADALAEMVTSDRLAVGALYPPQSALRAISRRIAIAVVRESRDRGLGRGFRDEEIEPAVDRAMWFPAYVPYRPV